MTGKEFNENEANRARLAEILDDAVFKTAVEIALFESIPRADSTAQAHEVTGNSLLQQLVGMRHLVERELPRLAAPPKPAIGLTERRLYTEADRDLLKQQQQQA